MWRDCAILSHSDDGECGRALPDTHPERFRLANEVHARPHEPLRAPGRASYLAVLLDPAARAAEHAHVAALGERYGVHPPPADAIHFAAALGPFRLRWERHTEFSSYTFFVAGRGARPVAAPAPRALPPAWRRGSPGRPRVAPPAPLL